jgi:hypothetical protein
VDIYVNTEAENVDKHGNRFDVTATTTAPDGSQQHLLFSSQKVILGARAGRGGMVCQRKRDAWAFLCKIKVWMWGCVLKCAQKR